LGKRKTQVGKEGTLVQKEGVGRGATKDGDGKWTLEGGQGFEPEKTSNFQKPSNQNGRAGRLTKEE